MASVELLGDLRQSRGLCCCTARLRSPCDGRCCCVKKKKSVRVQKCPLIETHCKYFAPTMCTQVFHVPQICTRCQKCDLAAKEPWNTLLPSTSVSPYLYITLLCSLQKKQRAESIRHQAVGVKSFNFHSSLPTSQPLNSDDSKCNNASWTERLKSPVWIPRMTRGIRMDKLNRSHSSIHHCWRCPWTQR